MTPTQEQSITKPTATSWTKWHTFVLVLRLTNRNLNHNVLHKYLSVGIILKVFSVSLTPRPQLWARLVGHLSLFTYLTDNFDPFSLAAAVVAATTLQLQFISVRCVYQVTYSWYRCLEENLHFNQLIVRTKHLNNEKSTVVTSNSLTIRLEMLPMQLGSSEVRFKQKTSYISYLVNLTLSIINVKPIYLIWFKNTNLLANTIPVHLL